MFEVLSLLRFASLQYICHFCYAFLLLQIQSYFRYLHKQKTICSNIPIFFTNFILFVFMFIYLLPPIYPTDSFSVWTSPQRGAKRCPPVVCVALVARSVRYRLTIKIYFTILIFVADVSCNKIYFNWYLNLLHNNHSKTNL